jgi:hypothetical protein
LGATCSPHRIKQIIDESLDPRGFDLCRRGRVTKYLLIGRTKFGVFRSVFASFDDIARRRVVCEPVKSTDDATLDRPVQTLEVTPRSR